MITKGRLKARRAIMLGGTMLLSGLLSGCHAVVLDPSGDVANQQRNLVLISTALMLLIIIPVMLLTVLFAWHYRESNTRARYEPEWHHSTQLELVIWAAPLMIIICLGALTWMGTHILDPYRQIGRLAPGRAMPADVKPLQVDVVALDWKWLFIYPELGVATVNELASPVNRPIDFRITSSTVMNSFYVPALAGQIYAMPGMETKLHAVINKPGDYEGFSANYSGAGFSGMRFRFHGLSDTQFTAWVDHVKQTSEALTRATYLQLERPSEDEPVRNFASVAPDLYHAVLNLCVEAGKMCMDDMMRIDAKGGMGLAGAYDVLPLAYDKYAGRGSNTAARASYFVGSICNTNDRNGTGEKLSPEASLPAPGFVSQGLFGRAWLNLFLPRKRV